MSDDSKLFELGLYVSRERDCTATNKIKVTVVRRSDDGNSIRNLSSTSWDQRLDKRHQQRHYDNLSMAGQVYDRGDGGKELIAYDPRYQVLYYVELREARKIAKTLADFEKAKAKWYATNGEIKPANMFGILAKFVDAKFVVFKDNLKGRSGRTYDQEDWNFLTVSEGLALYSRRVDELIAEHVSEKERVA